MAVTGGRNCGGGDQTGYEEFFQGMEFGGWMKRVAIVAMMKNSQ
jgi:hypothetical protein